MTKTWSSCSWCWRSPSSCATSPWRSLTSSSPLVSRTNQRSRCSALLQTLWRFSSQRQTSTYTACATPRSGERFVSLQDRKKQKDRRGFWRVVGLNIPTYFPLYSHSLFSGGQLVQSRHQTDDKHQNCLWKFDFFRWRTFLKNLDGMVWWTRQLIRSRFLSKYSDLPTNWLEIIRKHHC